MSVCDGIKLTPRARARAPLLTLSQLTVQPSSPDAETDDAGDPVQELCGKQDGERLVKEHAFGETLKERKKEVLMEVTGPFFHMQAEPLIAAEIDDIILIPGRS